MISRFWGRYIVIVQLVTLSQRFLRKKIMLHFQWNFRKLGMLSYYHILICISLLDHFRRSYFPFSHRIFHEKLAHLTLTFKNGNSSKLLWGCLWSWSYGSWIYNYLCNQCLSPLKLWVQTPFIVTYTWYIIMW